MDIPMELLRFNLSKVRIPEPTNRIYKHECCISFDTPKSEGGLFVDMCSFLAFGRDYVMWNYEKTANAVYLCIKQTAKAHSPENRPFKKPTLLAIGVDGGFDNQEIEYEETYSIHILPDNVCLQWPSVELPEKVRLAVDKILIAEGAERKQQVDSWVAEKKKVSIFAINLYQINAGIVVPPSGWKCCKCDKIDNLWLNLTDGMILCGRKNWDGSGGNDHAVEHYNITKYPLSVKLGTITADLETADVFSYPEDESVEDPLLADHLSFFGIDISRMQKTEMTTAERELDQNTNFDWNRIEESGHEMQSLIGPGYTGLYNLGNSCYLAATMQVVFSTQHFQKRYFNEQSLKNAFVAAPADPTVDLNTQLAKLGYGLLSGRYSFSTTENQNGIPPQMFKSVISSSHPEFSTMQQQDALEFFLHLLDQVGRANVGKPDSDPSRSFKFYIEERLQCSSGKVSYNKRPDYILSLNIPLSEATNREQLEAFNKLKEKKKSQGIEVSSEESVRPRVPLDACLANFSAPEHVPEFYSTELNAKTTAVKTAGFTTFPDYLVFHMRRFVMEEGWVPKKLDVFVDVPDVIDISHMGSKGLQQGEELLPDTAIEAESSTEPKLNADNDIVSKLAAMGFKYFHCQKAAMNTSNAGVEEAMNWLLTHMDDTDIDAPIIYENKIEENVLPINEASVETLVSFGFKEEVAVKALRASDGNIEKATDWIFSHPEASNPVDMDVSPSSPHSSTVSELPDGNGKYKLMGLVSHVGTSTHCGHYVAHVLKEGRWVIFNDTKVAVSINPPRDLGYLYFFERINS